jgi:uncharacterized protein
MTPFLHTASVPVFTQMLTALSALLGKAQAHAVAKNIEPSAFLQARLFPDMFPLERQVLIASDFAQSIAARLAGVEVPTTAAVEASFDALQLRLTQTLLFIEGLKVDAFAGRETQEILLRPGTPKEKRLNAQAYLLGYGLPQFFFHVTTAYAILRHNGVDVGKKDYMGSY